MFLPYFYTLFREANTTGIPVVRPLWMEFPSDESTFTNDEAFMVGNALLVQGVYEEVLKWPCLLFLLFLLPFYFSCLLHLLLQHSNWSTIFSLNQRAKHISVYLPGKESWFDIRTGARVKGGATHKLEVSEESVPAFQRAGTIIPRRDRFRRSSTQMVNDPYTLVRSWLDFDPTVHVLQF